MTRIPPNKRKADRINLISFTELSKTPQSLGWCAYCKDPVEPNEPYKKRGKAIYHEFCFDQERDQVEELKFE